MDIRPDDTQQSIIDLAWEVTAADGAAWAALGQAGLLILAVPERLGGAGLGILETVLVLTEIGRSALDGPALAHLAIGVPTVARWGGDRQQDELLGGGVLGVAVAEPGDPLPVTPRTVLSPDGTVTGVKAGVFTGDRILVTVEGPGVVVVDPATSGVHLEPAPPGGRLGPAPPGGRLGPVVSRDSSGRSRVIGRPTSGPRSSTTTSPRTS